MKPIATHPNKYDLSFFKWYKKHGAQIHSYFFFHAIDVWAHDGERCPFKITKGMIERLQNAMLIEERFPEDAGLWDRYFGLKNPLAGESR